MKTKVKHKCYSEQYDVKPRRHLSSFQIIFLGFSFVILVGALLLTTPAASADHHWTPFIDAVFTATSSVCVTGLIVHDTATYWSLFGQIVIIVLIQIGGLGVVTFAVSIAMLSGRKIGLSQRNTMQAAISAPKVGGIVRLTKFILKGTLLIEGIGAAIMAPTFIKNFGVVKGLWYAVFHSISAFCNAGFDLMGVREKYSSLTAFAANPAINLAIILLIVIGGLGFVTWEDIVLHKFQFRRYRLQSKIILTVTLLLIVIPAVYFYFGEFASAPGSERFWMSLFQSVTPRTAGFNTADLTKMSETGLITLIFLMLIGGSPGSTAGGMKTTTFAVLFLSMISVFGRRDDTACFGRRINEDAVRNAATIAGLYVLLFLFGGLFISKYEGISALAALFDTASAIGTVGLSLGITPHLHFLSKLIEIALMFCGRVGALTLVYAAVSPRNRGNARYPRENVVVG